MTVQELMDQLRKCEPDVRVFVQVDGSDKLPALGFYDVVLFANRDDLEVVAMQGGTDPESEHGEFEREAGPNVFPIRKKRDEE